MSRSVPHYVVLALKFLLSFPLFSPQFKTPINYLQSNINRTSHSVLCIFSLFSQEKTDFFGKMERLIWLWGVIFFGILLLGKWGAQSFELDEINIDNWTNLLLLDPIYGVYAAVAEAPAPNVLMVPLTLIQGPAEAVCSDGTLPGYHFDSGFGTGANSWLVNLEGGGWCNNVRTCVYRKNTSRGSSTYFEKEIPFNGILSNNASQNPDFFNWNRVKIRYCDGASFAGDSEDQAVGLQFRGQRIYEAAMEELMSKGMNRANQALLSGCSAGGLASILHCDEFRPLFPESTKVKCLADAGLFMDVADVSGGHTIRNLFGGVVSLQGVQRNLPSSCLLDPTSCFFPQNLIANIKTPLFILNAAYDSWQILESLAPPKADPSGTWRDCRKNYQLCSASQIQFLQDFRNQMLNALKGFTESTQNGLFINSCFAHCQSEAQGTWFADSSPVIGNKTIAVAVGDWYFDRASTYKDVDCAYPCGNQTCHNLVFR